MLVKARGLSLHLNILLAVGPKIKHETSDTNYQTVILKSHADLQTAMKKPAKFPNDLNNKLKKLCTQGMRCIDLHTRQNY